MGTSLNGQGGGGSADRGGTAATTMGPMWMRGVSVGGGLGQGLSYVPRGVVPKFPAECPPYVYIAWKRRFDVFIANQGLGHTISPDAPQITHTFLAILARPLSRNTDGYGGTFAKRLLVFPSRIVLRMSLSFGSLRTMRERALPLQPAERHLLMADLEGVQFMGDEDPNFFFARISRLETTMRAVGIEKSESEIVQIILRQLLERYDVVKTMTLADPQLTRSRLENTIRATNSQRKAHEIAKQGPAAGAPAEPSNPYALVVGRGFGDGGAWGGGGQRRDDGMVLRGGDMRQQQQQQHWSCGGGMPRRQQQQQQHWSRGGGMPRQQQQQWSRGGGIPHQHQRSFHVFPPARQAR